MQLEALARGGDQPTQGAHGGIAPPVLVRGDDRLRRPGAAGEGGLREPGPPPDGHEERARVHDARSYRIVYEPAPEPRPGRRRSSPWRPGRSGPGELPAHVVEAAIVVVGDDGPAVLDLDSEHGCTVIYNRMVVDYGLSDDQLDRLFHALAHATRRDIVRQVLTAEHSVSELARTYDVSFAAVQKHVAVLEAAGLVIKRAEGRERLVRADPAMIARARELLRRYEDLWRARIDQLDALLAEDPAGASASGHTHRPPRPIDPPAGPRQKGP